MANPVWGALEKALDDDQTILEAIDAKIAAHEADEEAHLGAGESLQSHRASDIIDHVKNSVVRDKLAFDRFAIDDSFYSIDAWDKTAGVEQMSIGDIELMTGGTTNNYKRMQLIEGEGIEGQSAMGLNPIWQTRVKFYHNSNQVAYVGQLLNDANSGYGFKVVNGGLYAVYFDGDGVEQTHYLSSITAYAWVVLGCEVSGGDSIDFYVDGVLVYSLTDLVVQEGDSLMTYYIKTTENSPKIMHVQALHFDADYVD